MFNKYEFDKFNNSDNPTAVAFHEIDREILHSIKRFFSFICNGVHKTKAGSSEENRRPKNTFKKMLKH